jgi:uncharacterized protein (TIGR02569 family)
MSSVAPPALPVLDAFGIPDAYAIRLPGPGGRAFRFGQVVAKFVGGDADEATIAWLAALFDRLPRTDFRVPRLIPSRCGTFVCHGWIAMEWLAGVSRQGGWAAKVAASRAFHAALRDIAPPAFFRPDNGVWATADRVAWNEEVLAVNPYLRPLVEPLLERRIPISCDAQFVHGDLSRANLFLEAGQPPAILDFAPYWRPLGLALAVMAVDEIAWHGESVEVLDEFPEVEQWDQMLLRAALIRLIGLQELARLHPAWNWHNEVSGLRPVVHAISLRLGASRRVA